MELELDKMEDHVRSALEGRFGPPGFLPRAGCGVLSIEIMSFVREFNPQCFDWARVRTSKPTW